MSEVFFLHGTRDRMAAIVEWLTRAWQRREQVSVFVPRPEMAERLSRALWSQNPISFVPHCMANAPQAAETPIIFARQPEECRPVVLNLSDQLEAPPPGTRQLIEIVSNDDGVKLPARARAKQYKTAGLTVNFQDISSGL